MYDIVYFCRNFTCLVNPHRNMTCNTTYNCWNFSPKTSMDIPCWLVDTDWTSLPLRHARTNIDLQSLPEAVKDHQHIMNKIIIIKQKQKIPLNTWLAEQIYCHTPPKAWWFHVLPAWESHVFRNDITNAREHGHLGSAGDVTQRWRKTLDDFISDHISQHI